MSAPKSPKHILRRVREVLKLSRRKLAIMSGCSAIYIRKIEAGEVPMTRALAQRVSYATAADPIQLFKDDHKPPRNMGGELLTKDSPQIMDRLTRTMPIEHADGWVERFRFHVEWLLDAALLAPRSRFLNVAIEIEHALNAIEDQFELGKFKAQIFKEYGFEQPRFENCPSGKKPVVQQLRAARYAARAKAFEESAAVTSSNGTTPNTLTAAAPEPVRKKSSRKRSQTA